MNYLCQALKGNHQFTDEDRLSQVFAATFNNSEVFRKQFFGFIGCSASSGAWAETQECFHEGSQSRPDICIFVGKTVKIVIENKIEAPLKSNQLLSYSRPKELRRARKIALVKHFFESPAQAKDWKILRWSEFYRSLEHRLERMPHDRIDHFLIKEFVSFLEDIGMRTPIKINRSALRDLAKAIYQLRNQNAPSFSLKNAAFETANAYIDMLEEVVNITRKDEKLSKRLGRNYRFNPWVGSWLDAEDKDRKRWRVLLCVEIYLKRKAVKRLGAGLLFSNQKADQYDLLVYAEKKNGDWQDVRFVHFDLTLDEYAAAVVREWKRWLG